MDLKKKEVLKLIETEVDKIPELQAYKNDDSFYYGSVYQYSFIHNTLIKTNLLQEEASKIYSKHGYLYASNLFETSYYDFAKIGVLRYFIDDWNYFPFVNKTQTLHDIDLGVLTNQDNSDLFASYYNSAPFLTILGWLVLQKQQEVIDINCQALFKQLNNIIDIDLIKYKLLYKRTTNFIQKQLPELNAAKHLSIQKFKHNYDMWLNTATTCCATFLPYLTLTGFHYNILEEINALKAKIDKTIDQFASDYKVDDVKDNKEFITVFTSHLIWDIRDLCSKYIYGIRDLFYILTNTKKWFDHLLTCLDQMIYNFDQTMLQAINKKDWQTILDNYHLYHNFINWEWIDLKKLKADKKEIPDTNFNVFDVYNTDWRVDDLTYTLYQRSKNLPYVLLDQRAYLTLLAKMHEQESAQINQCLNEDYKTQKRVIDNTNFILQGIRHENQYIIDHNIGPYTKARLPIDEKLTYMFITQTYTSKNALWNNLKLIDQNSTLFIYAPQTQAIISLDWNNPNWTKQLLQFHQEAIKLWKINIIRELKKDPNWWCALKKEDALENVDQVKEK